MDIRHLAIKSPEGVSYRRDVVIYDKPLVIPMSRDEKIYKVDKPTDTGDSGSIPARLGVNAVEGTKFGDIIKKRRGSGIRSLCEIFAYKGDLSFNSIEQERIAKDMFPSINPVTGEQDIDEHSDYAKFIPLVILSGAMTPQELNGVSYFNPEGTVSRAEFIDGLNAIKYGSNANNRRKKTLDNVSTESDYFNEGYQECLHMLASPFFNLYTRSELVEPITRFELAYIVVLCWSQFLDKYNTPYGGRYYLGFNFDWEYPADELSVYSDGFDYNVSKRCEDKNVVLLDIHEYKDDKSMTEYIASIKEGVSAIPMPALMSMVELGLLDLFPYNNRLDPLREVSRGELCYFLTMLAREFKTLYI